MATPKPALPSALAQTDDASDISDEANAIDTASWLGKVLGGVYRVDSLIGTGGMGAVYEATHIHLGRKFAIKVLNDSLPQDVASKRLLMEARAASALRHPNIVDVVSFDSTDDGRVFLVMERLYGESLAARIERGPMPAADALRITEQVASALAMAHGNGVIHRDLKPENVFIVANDPIVVKVLDFGISRVLSDDPQSVRVTQTGQLVGTPLYMSPEQAKGELEVDHRADIYSLGVMLFEMLTGRPPFEGKNYFQLLWKHGNEDAPRLSTSGVHVAAHVEALVERCLAKHPDARPQTMAEFAQALQPNPGITDQPMLPKRSWGRWAAVAIVALTGAAAFYLVGRSESERPTHPLVSRDATAPLTARPATQTLTEAARDIDSGPRVLPDGTDAPILISFRSNPTGAEVRIGGHTVCTTPCSAPVQSPQVVFLRKSGYRPQRVPITAEDSQVSIRLVSEATSGPAIRDEL